MEIAETGTATTSGLAKTLRHFGLDTRTPGLQREDRRAELQKRLGEFERARRVPPPPTNLLSRKTKQAPAPPHSSLAPPAGPTRGAPPPPSSSPSRKANKIGRPLLIPPPPPAEHTRVREDVQSNEEKTTFADGEVRGPQRAPKRLPESKLPDTSFDCVECGLTFKKVAHLIVHSRSHNRDKPSRASQPVLQTKSTIRGKIDHVKYPSSSDEDDQDSEEDNNGGGDDDDDDDDADILNEQSHSHFDDAGDVRGLVEGLSIAEDNQDANSTLESKTRDRADNADAAHDEAWIEEFARGLVQIARQSGAATRSPKSKSSPQRAPAVLRKMRTAPARALVPPPRGAPPLHLARTASAHVVLVSPKHKREGRTTEKDWNDKQAIHDGTDVDALRREIEELDRKRAARIRSRLHDSKDVEIQEAEWDLQRVQQELRRVERHRGIFIDSRLASQSGHMQRWAKEDLLPKLEALEREANARLEQEISRIRAEEESHPQYGRQAQNERRFKLHQMQNRHGNASLDDDASMSAIRGGGLNKSRQRADADEIGREALALHMGKRDLARAETLYRRALALDGRHATNLGNLALFIQQFGTSQHGRRDEESKSIEDSGHRNRAHDDGDESYRKACDAQADKFYRQAISADPSHSTNLANYASFLHKNLRQYERAEQYYERAVHEAPANASILGNFAVFLFRVRRDLVRADRMFQRALEIDPKHVNNCCNYASLLKKGFGKHREARALYEDALKINPENPTVLCNYANMLVKGADPADASPEACAQIQKARDLYLLALRVNPSHRMAKRNYMIFLRDFPTVRNMANERKLSEARPPPGPRPPQVHAGRVVSPPTSPTSPTSPKSRRRSQRSRSPHAAARRPMSPTLETLIE